MATSMKDPARPYRFPLNFMAAPALAAMLAWPLVGGLGLIVMKEITVDSVTATRMPIIGYDPRDYLHGHYLRFQFASDSANDRQPHEYFIPEDAAPALDRLLRGREHHLSVDARLSQHGAIGFGMLYIDDMPWRDYLNTHPDEAR